MACVFYCVAVRGELTKNYCEVFGLNPEEISALSELVPQNMNFGPNYGIAFYAPPMTVINTLCQRGYKVVGVTGKISLHWALQRRDPHWSSVHQTLDELEFERSLGFVALCGEVEKVKQHLHKGTNVNSYDSGGYAPLHYAVCKGHLEIAHLLLLNGGDINIRTRAGEATPLLHAAYSGKEEMSKFLVEKGAENRAADDGGQSVVHRSISSGNFSLVKYFIGIAPELKIQPDKRGQAPSDTVMSDLWIALHVWVN